jgi:hypothetical protein
MNNFSFLDTAPNAQNMPRAAPSPTTSQPPQANGMVGGAGGGPVGGGGGQQNGIPMVNGLPSGGQQTDMNHLWGVVQQLSQMLEENRAQTAGIVNGVQAIQQRAAEEGGLNGGLGMREVNGELNGMCTSSLVNSSYMYAPCSVRNSSARSEMKLTKLLAQQHPKPPNSQPSNPTSPPPKPP